MKQSFVFFLVLIFFTFDASGRTDIDSASQRRQKRTKRSIPKTQRKAEKHYGIFFEWKSGMNSNPDFGSETQWDLDNTVDLSGYYRFIATNTADLRISYAFQKAWYRDHPSSEFGDHRLGIPFAYYFSNHRLRLMPEFILDFYGDALFSRNIAANLSLVSKFKWYQFGSSYRLTKIQVSNDEDASLNGFIHELTIFGTKPSRRQNKQLSINLDKYDYNDTNDSTASYHSIRAGYSQSWYLRKWDFNVSSSLEYRVYSKATTDTESRIDKKFTLSSEVGFIFMGHFRSFLELEFSRNLSNQFDSTYSQGSAKLGISASL